MKLKIAMAASAMLGLTAPAYSATVYSNNFDTENGGVSAQGYTAFKGLTVSDGTVNLVHTGDGSGITCEGGAGGCVDLGGDTDEAGNLTSGNYSYAAGNLLALGIGSSGSQRSGDGTSGFAIGFNFAVPTSGTFTLSDSSGLLFGDSFTDETQFGIVSAENSFDQPFDDVVFTVQPTTAGSFSFFVDGSSPDPADTNNDNVGIVVDNLSLAISAVPEPSTWAMMIAGIGLIGIAMRRPRSAILYARA